MTEFTDDDLRRMWRAAGGRFHGPHVETGTMPEANLLRFLREMLAVGARPVLEASRDALLQFRGLPLTMRQTEALQRLQELCDAARKAKA